MGGRGGGEYNCRRRMAFQIDLPHCIRSRAYQLGRSVLLQTRHQRVLAIVELPKEDQVLIMILLRTAKGALDCRCENETFSRLTPTYRIASIHRT